MVILIGDPHDHSDDEEPSSVVPMTTVMMIRVGNDQICVIITAGEEMTTVKKVVWATTRSVCDHHSDDGVDVYST